MARTDRRPRVRLDPDERRSAILEAAAEAFGARPYGEVTLTEIATAAEASNALLYRYFDGKEALYAELVRLGLAALKDAQDRSLARLADGVPARDRIRAVTLVYLDRIAARPEAWAMPLRNPGGEPAAAAELRARARREQVAFLAGLLPPSGQARHEYALWGYVGFVDAACLRWVEHGCPEDHRWSLVDAALGSLEGALGDWAA